MPPSFFHKCWPWSADPGYSLVYGCRRGAYLLFPPDEYENFLTGTIDQETRELLTGLDLMVQDQVQEVHEVRHFIQQVNEQSEGLCVSIILGMACNFRCRYCYEGTQKGARKMTDATAAESIAFIKQRLSPDLQRLTLDFYGGEPLLYTDRIMEISSAMQQFMTTRGGEFRITLVTNGSLLSREIVRDLATVGLTSVKITIDGPPEVHNHFRPYRNGKPSFATILQNIQACCDLIKISVGGNFTAATAEKFPELLDHFGKIGLTPEKLATVKFDPVMQINDKYSHTEFRSGCQSINEPWVVEGGLMLREEVLKRGYKTPEITPTLCMVDMKNSFTIHYNGDIYKCPSIIGHDEYRIGTVAHGITPDNYPRYHQGNWQQEEKCSACAYLPLCFGGCRYMAFQRTGSMRNVDCRKEYLDSALETMIVQDIRYRHRNAV